MEPWRPVQRSFYNYWGEGQGSVDIFVHSAPNAVDPRRADRVHVVLYQQNRSFLVGAPLFVENEGFLTPPIQQTWVEDLADLGSFEMTVAGQAIAAHIRSVPHLRDFVQDYFIDMIANEARDVALTALSLQHRVAWVIIDLNITIHLSYDGPGDDSDDEDDGGSYVDEVDAEGGDAVMGDAEVDPPAPEEVGADAEVQQLAAPEEMGADAEVQQLAAPEEVGADAEVQQLAALEEVGADAEVQQLAAPEGVVVEVEVDPAEAEGMLGNAAAVQVQIGDIVLEGIVGDLPGNPDEFVELETVLSRLLGQPAAPFLEAVGLRRGLTPAAIAYHLTVDNFMGADPQTCSICLENMVNGTQAGWLPCSHVFHPECIANWLERNGICPICRFMLSNNIGD